MHFGQTNNKLALFDRRKMEFPVIDDLDIKGGNEVEGHYQPVPKKGQARLAIGRLQNPLWHHIHESGEDWRMRHERYALWEAGMNKRKAWPEDPVRWRQFVKAVLRESVLRPFVMFGYSYFLKGGILNGAAGFLAARNSFSYYRLIGKLSR